MFRKDFKAKSQTQVKSSDRKKLRQQFQEFYPQINEEILSLIVPSGKNDDLTSCKLLLHNGDDAMLYSTNKIPWFFSIEDRSAKRERVYPTVYLLWKCPDLIELKFRTHRQVFTKLLNGADLMLPGVIVPSGVVTLDTFRHVKRDELCSICLDDNRFPIGIGLTALDGEDMYMSGMKGRAVILLHIYQDVLWNFGPKTEAPYEKLDGIVEPIIENPETPTANPPESMDEILDAIFFYLCQRKAKHFELPLLASHFYTLMQDCVPGLTLDLKQSSHKKFSKFLQHQQEIRQLICLEEIKPGVLSISGFHLTNNDILDAFRTPQWLKIYLEKGSTATAAEASDSATSKYTFPTIVELWKSNSRVSEFFREYPANSYFRAEEIRQAVRCYVLKNQLNEEKKVRADAFLSRLCSTDDLIDWNELNQSVFNAMSPCVEFQFAHLEQPIRVSGSITPIELECIDRNRKRQTFIRHLDVYQIDLQDLSKRIRQGASVSVTIDENQEVKRQGRIVMAQGNQISFVTRLLKEIYGVPNKFIREID